MLFEGLTRMGLEEKPELALAERYMVSRDGLCYTFFLRKAKWNNGTPIVAEDFVAAWRSVLDPSFSSPFANELFVLDKGREDLGVKAIDSSTLEVHLSHPIPYFLSLIATPAFLPIPTKSLHKKGKKVVSNGPFQLRKEKGTLQLEASPSYWDRQRVALKELEFIPASMEEATALFLEGKLDCVPNPAPLAAVKRAARPSLEISFLSLNTSLPQLENPLFRRALGYAIDRQALVDKGLGGEIPATALVPSSFGLEEKPYFADGSLEKAQMLFEQVREKLSLKELSLLYIAGDKAEKIAQGVQQFWAAAFGLTIQLEAVEEKGLFCRLRAKEYVIALSSYQAAVADPIDFLRLFATKDEPLNYRWESKMTRLSLRLP